MATPLASTSLSVRVCVRPRAMLLAESHAHSSYCQRRPILRNSWRGSLCLADIYPHTFLAYIIILHPLLYTASLLSADRAVFNVDKCESAKADVNMERL